MASDIKCPFKGCEVTFKTISSAVGRITAHAIKAHFMTGMTNFVRDLPHNLDKQEMKPDKREMKPTFHKIDSCVQNKRLAVAETSTDHF